VENMKVKNATLIRTGGKRGNNINRICEKHLKPYGGAPRYPSSAARVTDLSG